MNGDARPVSDGSLPAVALVMLLGIAAGAVAAGLGGLALRWTIYAGLGVAALAVLTSFRNKGPLLVAVFVLSLQVDVYVRFLYGKAGSDGIAFPLVFLTGLALAVWYVLSPGRPRLAWAGRSGWPIAALLASMVLATATSSEHFVSLTSLVAALQMYMLYWLAFNLVRSEQEFRRVVGLLLVTLGIQSLVYFYQSATGQTFNLAGYSFALGEVPRPGGTVSSNPAGYASFIMPALMLASAAALARAAVLPRGVMLLLAGMGVVAIGLTYTRAAWIGLALGLTAIMILGVRRRAIASSRVLLLVGLMALAALALAPTLLARIASDYGTAEAGNQATLNERLGLMRVALNVIASHPLTGVGPGAYGHVFKAYVPGGLDQWLYTVHNEFLLKTAELGIAGGIAFVALLATALGTARRLAQEPDTYVGIMGLGWFGALVALIWQMNWVPWSGFSYNAMLWLVLGLMDGAWRLRSMADAMPAADAAWEREAGDWDGPGPGARQPGDGKRAGGAARDRASATRKRVY